MKLSLTHLSDTMEIKRGQFSQITNWMYFQRFPTALTCIQKFAKQFRKQGRLCIWSSSDLNSWHNRKSEMRKF